MRKLICSYIPSKIKISLQNGAAERADYFWGVLLCAISYVSLQMAAHCTYLLCQLFWNIYYHKHVQSITLYQWKRSVQQFSWWPFEELWRRRTDMVVSCQKVFGGLWNISLESNAKLQEGAVIICHHKETSYHRSLTE